MQELWEEHLGYEFATHNTEKALATMVEDAYVNSIPVMTGGVGKPAVREFYAKDFIPQIPPDTEMTPISHTISTEQLVDEMVLKFTQPLRWTGCYPALLRLGNGLK